MKKFMLLVLSALLSSLAGAEIIVVENFEYDDFTTPLVNQSAWTNDYSTSASANAYITGGLSFSSYAGCGVGNAVVVEGETGSYHPSLEFTQQTEGTIYTAFMFQALQCYKSGFVFSLRQSMQNNDYTMNGRIWIDVDDDYDAYFGLRFSKASEIVVSSKKIDPQKVYLVVLKYEIVEGSNNDRASLYVLDSFTSAEPSEPLIGPLSDSSKPDMNPGVVMLRGLDTGWFVYDGIRVATTWEEAVAAGVCPEEVSVELIEDDKRFELYDILGNYIGCFTELPKDIRSGIYISRSANGSKKIVLR